MVSKPDEKRKVIVFNMVSLDGFFEWPNHDINWHNVDQEFNEFATEQINSVDGPVFGRLTYQLMAGYWPTDAALADDPIIASKMNNLPKVVFSKMLQKAEWNNTTLINGDLAEEISQFKQRPGRDLIIFGSANLTASLTNLGLIDEYRLMVNPVVLGAGTPMFRALRRAFNSNF